MRGTTDLRTALARPDALEVVLVLAAGVTWLLHLTQQYGGFHDPSTAVTAAATLPALLAVRPWRTVRPVVLALTCVTALGAVAALTLTAAGWQQADSPAAQLLGLLALVVVAGFARTAPRRLGVAAFVVAGVVVEALPAYKSWTGSGDPNTLMVGTFYWHNQLGAWMAALAVVCTALATRSGGALRWFALASAPVAAASVVLSTSRTSLGLLVLGLLCVVPRRRSWTAWSAWAAVPAAGVAVLLLVTSGIVFDTAWHGLSAVQTTAATSSVAGERGTDSIASNGGDRGRWTVAALDEFADSPLLGRGFGSFASTVDDHVAPGRTVSSFVHNGYAEALTSGGLVFGLPFLALWVLVGWAAVRHWWRGPPELAGCGVAAGLLLAHSAVDFDWHYPSLVVLLGVLGGVLLSAEPTRTPLPAVPVAAGLTAVVVAVATMSLVEHHGRSLVTTPSDRSATAWLDTRWPGFPDPRLDRAALRACLGTTGQLVVSPDVARRVLAETARSGELDDEVAALRETVHRAL